MRAKMETQLGRRVLSRWPSTLSTYYHVNLALSLCEPRAAFLGTAFGYPRYKFVKLRHQHISYHTERIAKKICRTID